MYRFKEIHSILNSIANDIQPKDIEAFSLLSTVCDAMDDLENKIVSDIWFDEAMHEGHEQKQIIEGEWVEKI